MWSVPIRIPVPPGNAARRDPAPPPSLLCELELPGTGSSRLLEPNVDLDGLRAQVRAVLSTVRAATEQAAADFGEVYGGPPLLRLISPLAEGADQLVASEALELGYSLHVPLPCLPEIYTAAFQRSSQGETEDPCAGFQRLMARAESVQVIDGSPAIKLDGAAYAAVGRAVLRHADILIAIWDQSPADGAGGTAAVVDQARSWLLPVLVIDPRHPVTATLDDVAGLPPGADLATVVRDLLAPPPADAGVVKPPWWRRLFHVAEHRPAPAHASGCAAQPSVSEPLLQRISGRGCHGELAGCSHQSSASLRSTGRPGRV